MKMNILAHLLILLGIPFSIAWIHDLTFAEALRDMSPAIAFIAYVEAFAVKREVARERARRDRLEEK